MGSCQKLNKVEGVDNQKGLMPLNVRFRAGAGNPNPKVLMPFSDSIASV
jgi:hypothetical protein